MKPIRLIITLIIAYVLVGYLSTAIVDYKYSEGVSFLIKLIDRTRDALLQNWEVKLMFAILLTALMIIISSTINRIKHRLEK